MNWLYVYLYGWMVTFIAFCGLDGYPPFWTFVFAFVNATLWPAVVPVQMVFKLFSD